MVGQLAAGRRAIELAPDYPQSFNNVGGAYFELGDYAQAAEHYRRAVALDLTDRSRQSATKASGTPSARSRVNSRRGL
jgi:tetratricopeptide (TPR) repeat protein